MLLDLFRDRTSLRYLDQSGVLPYAPTDFEAGLDVSWAEGHAPDLFNEAPAAMRSKYAAAIEAYQKETGQPLENPYDNQIKLKPRETLPAVRRRRQAATDAALDSARKVFPQIPDPFRFQAEIADESKALREKGAKAAALTVGWGQTGLFIGGNAAFMTQPTQLALMPLGGPAGGVARSFMARLLVTTLTDAGLGALSQASAEALDYQSRKRFGTQQTLDEALRNIGMATAGGAIIGRGFRVLAAAGRGLLNLRKQPLPVRDAVVGSERAAFDAAGQHGESAMHAAAATQATLDVAAGQAPQVRTREYPNRRTADPADLEGSALRFIDETTAAPSKHMWLTYGQLPEWTIKLADRLGIRVGPTWTRTLDSGHVRKILREHGDPAIEAARGHVAITPADIARYPMLVERYSEARVTKANRDNMNAIVYLVHDPAGTTFIVEEVRTKRGNLSLGDMWKWAPGKGPKGLDQMPGRSGATAKGNKASAETSASKTAKPTAANPDPTQNIVRQSPGGKVYTPAGRAVEVEHEVVEAGSLVTSHGADLTANPAFPPELQPRDRSRAASEAQIGSMAAALEPERLAGGVDAATGAPIVGPDGVVESGNGRTLAIRKAYADGTAAAYREHLKRLGYDVDGMKEPVLVRRRVTGMTPEERIAFAREANEATTLAMGAAEQALTDARRIPDSVLDLYQGGGVDLAKNSDFVRQIVKALPAGERAAMMTADGSLSQAGTRRIEAALLAKAYGDSGLIAKLTEAGDNDIKAIGGALQDAAAGWAQMRARVAAGELTPEVDATAHLLAAVRMVEQARKTGEKIGDLLAQGQMFGEGLTEAAHGFLRMLYRDGSLQKPAGRSTIAGRFSAYLDEANKSVPGRNLFGEPSSTAADILKVQQTDAAALQRGEDVTAATEALAEPEIDQALETEVARILETSDIDVPIEESMVEGTATAKTGSARDLMKAADERIKAAKEVQACAFGLAAE